MAKYRVWFGDDPSYKNMSSLAEAIKFIKKKPDFDESNSGLEELIDSDYWDEWLDEDDQNVHEHLYMYGGKSRYLRAAEEDEDDEDLDDEDLDDDEDIDEDEEEIDEEDGETEDLDERLMDVIGGGRATSTDDTEDEVFDDEDDLDDEDDDDLDDDLDDEEEEDL